MSEYLVEIVATLPGEMDSARRSTLIKDEVAHGVTLRKQGVIRHIWRVPGRIHSYAIWDVEDATQLHAEISAMPLFPFMSVTVTPLALHPVEAELRSIS